jgi:uncharacterized damage-inducible protein DinB
MTPIQLANRIQEVYLSGKWIANTNIKEQIEELTLAQATKQVNRLNTIALLVFHLNYYLEGLIAALTENKLEIRDKYSFLMDELKTEEEWQNLKTKLLSNADTFVSIIKNLENNQLSAPFVEEKYGSTWQNIIGVVEHSYYHFGQITIIRKMILQQ